VLSPRIDSSVDKCKLISSLFIIRDSSEEVYRGRKNISAKVMESVALAEDSVVLVQRVDMRNVKELECQKMV
jgi:hypothetical protein